MKTYTSVSVLAGALLLATIQFGFAQKGVSPVYPVTVSPTTTASAVSPSMSIVQSVQLAPTTMPEGVILPACPISLTSTGAANGEPGYVDGFNIELWDRGDAIEGFVVLDAETGAPVGPVSQMQGNFVPCYRTPVWNNSTRHFQIAILSKSDLTAFKGEKTKVVITGVVSTIPIAGPVRIEGPFLTLAMGPKAGEMSFEQGTSLPPVATAYPFVTRQPGLELVVSADSVENQVLPLLTVDVHARGGRIDDMQLAIVRADGSLFVYPRQVESSLYYGEGTVRFAAPFRQEKGPKSSYFIVVALGRSWKDGGSYSLSVTPNKSIARGELYGYMTIPQTPRVISGPTVLVQRVAYGEVQAKSLSIGSLLNTGHAVDLAWSSVTAPVDRALAIDSLSMFVVWSPAADAVSNPNIYAFTDTARTQPAPGTLNGAFINTEQRGEKGDGPVSLNRGNVFGENIGVQDRDRLQSAVIIPAGQTWYIGAVADVAKASQNATVFTALFTSQSSQLLAMQYLTR